MHSQIEPARPAMLPKFARCHRHAPPFPELLQEHMTRTRHINFSEDAMLARVEGGALDNMVLLSAKSGNPSIMDEGKVQC
jgi:hypothetical protein